MTSPNHRSRNASPQFRSIQAVFEQADVPMPRPFSRASPKSRTPTNDKQPSLVASLISRETFKDHQDTIDTLLASLDAFYDRHSTSPRDKLRQKSSWISPPPQPSHSPTAAMARKVTVTYSSPGLQPPVYITTSLSDPQWDLLEMGSEELPSGERQFVRTFHVPDGEYQYKFRLGPGDWWVCDENKPTVDDGLGNKNNVLTVKGDVPSRKHAAEQLSSVDDVTVFDSPTLPHERNSSQKHVKHDSLGDGVIGDSAAQDEKCDTHQHPLFAHEQNGSSHGKLEIPSEKVPVKISRQDTLALDDDDPDIDLLSGGPAFEHERDIEPARTPTPGVDEDEDDMHEPPLMAHEALSSPSSAKHATNPFDARDYAKSHHGHDSDVLVSPVSSHSSSQWIPTDSHIPAEADPNDPSLERFPTHHEGIMSSLRRSSQRMAEHEAKNARDIVESTSPIAKTVSHTSQTASLPSVLEDEEELEEGAADQPSKKVHGLAGLSTLSANHERPAALITPPRTPDESKDPANVGSSHDHHHKPAAEKDMREEATHDVKHNDSHQHHHEKAAHLDGSAVSSEAVKDADNQVETKSKKAETEKTGRSGIFETALGLGLVVAVGVGAAWLAFMMQDPIKDGGAALAGSS